MDFSKILGNISAGILVTDENFKVVWANKFEEDFYGRKLEDMKGISVIDCHKEENKAYIADFLQKFQNGEMTEYTKIAVGMVITYSSYYLNDKFAGIIRTRIRLPE